MPCVSALKKQPAASGERHDIEHIVIINDQSVMSGGAEAVALGSALALHDAGIAVTFISGDDGSKIDPRHRHLDFVPFGGRHIIEGPRWQAAVNGIFNYQAYRFLAAWIEKNDTARTVYHVHGWSKILSPSIFLALRAVMPRLAIHAHDYFLACPNGAFYDYHHQTLCRRRPLSLSCLSCHCDRRSYLQKLWRSARQFTLRQVLGLLRGVPVLPVHDGMKPLLALSGLPAKHMHTMCNPVKPWRSRRVEAEKKKDFLYVGRLNECKGVMHLARAARRAGISLLVAGTGSLAPRLQEEYPEIQLLGWKNRQELSSLSAEIRAVVIPSVLPEPFGLVAFEALLSGIPVIVSGRAMIAVDIVKRGWGLAGDPEDEQQFAALLKKMANDDLLVERASKRGYDSAGKLVPAPQKHADRLLSLYRKRLFEA